ncbi:hypothetical protein B566_EDAN003005 [Ephemera danica]|nr:hypothetical protein B566_EDAN003005 [Ephemera danica]
MVEDRNGVALQQVECATCRRAICDRYIMRVADASYHERCLLCCVCGTRLAHSCFTREAKLYCRLDYDRVTIPTCAPASFDCRSPDNRSTKLAAYFQADFST